MAPLSLQARVGSAPPSKGRICSSRQGQGRHTGGEGHLLLQVSGSAVSVSGSRHQLSDFSSCCSATLHLLHTSTAAQQQERSAERELLPTSSTTPNRLSSPLSSYARYFPYLRHKVLFSLPLCSPYFYHPRNDTHLTLCCTTFQNTHSAQSRAKVGL